MKGRHLRGFTLVELLVGIGVLGILAAVAVPVYKDSVSEGHGYGHKVRVPFDAKQVEYALEMYYQDHGTYPPDDRDLGEQLIEGTLVAATGAHGLYGIEQASVGGLGNENLLAYIVPHYIFFDPEYIHDNELMDPWGNAYEYVFPGVMNPTGYDFFSWGELGMPQWLAQADGLPGESPTSGFGPIAGTDPAETYGGGGGSYGGGSGSSSGGSPGGSSSGDSSSSGGGGGVSGGGSGGGIVIEGGSNSGGGVGGSSDRTPPAAPTGLVGSSPSFGVIFLDWNDNVERDLAKYRVKAGFSGIIPGVGSSVKRDKFDLVGDSHDSQFTNDALFPSGMSFRGSDSFFGVTAFDRDKNESEISNVISIASDDIWTESPENKEIINQVVATLGSIASSWLSAGVGSDTWEMGMHLSGIVNSIHTEDVAIGFMEQSGSLGFYTVYYSEFDWTFDGSKREAGSEVIALLPELLSLSPAALASVLAHEGNHLRWANTDITEPDSLIELNDYIDFETGVWGYPPDGGSRSYNSIDQEYHSFVIGSAVYRELPFDPNPTKDSTEDYMQRAAVKVLDGTFTDGWSYVASIYGPQFDENGNRIDLGIPPY